MEVTVAGTFVPASGKKGGVPTAVKGKLWNPDDLGYGRHSGAVVGALWRPVRTHWCPWIQEDSKKSFFSLGHREGEWAKREEYEGY